ncbi:SAM-dependent methyltransferase [Xenorhabdus khoisanae]|uniref:SAM-dependent methyltransferase n=1 Tax=Xenorhabdus khoisanae TaxID=880157 RepID=UPI00069CDD51|nr:SAM-dependent methyltransferase [Xenorhabdus khoisanae]
MSLPTKQDLIDWLLNNPDEVRNIVKGKLQYEPARTRDTSLFVFNDGMYFDGQLYRLCVNLHHTGVLGRVWLNGMENVSVNQHENPAADIIGNHLRELSNDVFNTDFPVEDENPSELAVAAEVEIVDSVACSAASNTKKQFYLEEQELSDDPQWQVVVVALEIDAPEVDSAASNTTKQFQPFRPQPLRGARLSTLATERAGATSTRPSRIAHAFGVRPGHLVIVGSGIKSLAQLTMEAVGHIKAADEVFYAVADPLTEAFIEKNAKKAHDMYILYDDGKPRLQTYVQMAEVMLRALRQGKYVVGVFYGHPGVFVNPSHRAIAIAKEEGFRAEMLAGISAEDNLFADIGIDPSLHGCQTLEATDLLLRKRILLTDSHVVIFQVGAVGNLGFNFSGFKNQHFQVLIDRLIKEYGPQHDVYLYVAPSIAIAKPLVEKYKIADFLKPEVVKQVTGISTFYLPPKTIRESDPAVGKLLGLKVLGNVGYAGPYTPGKPYSERELAAVSGLDGHTIPENYKRTRTTSSMFDALAQLSLYPEMKEEWLRNPQDFLQRFEGLSAKEHAAIISSQPGRIRAVMKKTPQQVAMEGNNEDAIQEHVAESNPGGDPVEPLEVPAQTAEAAELVIGDPLLHK